MARPASLNRLTAPTLADQAYQAMREAIISGELASNEKITERGLADRLAVSPTPVREALRRLEQDGLVARTGPRSVQVVDLEGEMAAEVRLAEDALRVVATRLAALHATDEQLARMEAILDAGDRELARLLAGDHDPDTVPAAALAPLLAITREFHTELNAGCNNDVLLRLLSMVDAFSYAARPRQLTDELRAEGNRAALERYHEHRAIFDAVRARDADQAERLMAGHAAADEASRLHS